MVFVPLKDGVYCMHENSKNRSPKRLDGPDCMLTGFLTFLPDPKKHLPSLRPAMGYRVLMRAAGGVYPAVTSRAADGTARPAPASAEGYPTILRIYPPPATREGAHPYAHHLTPSPRRSPPPLFTHLLQNLITSFGAPSALAGLSTCLFFSGRLQKLRKQRRCQRDIPLLPAH